MICALTHEDCKLRKSHIYPKFMWDFLKETGGDRFRPIHTPTQVLQDGEKNIYLAIVQSKCFLHEKNGLLNIFLCPFVTAL